MTERKSKGKPEQTLHELLLENNFLEPTNRSPLIHQTESGKNVFNMNQKRSLAARLVLCLAYFLDLEHCILQSWDPRNIFFEANDGKCEHESVYISSVLRKNEELPKDVKTQLAKLLLEIEYGYLTNSEQDIETLRLGVRNTLLDYIEELQKPKANYPDYDVRRLIDRFTYLEAVGRLLKPDMACRALNVNECGLFIYVAGEIYKTVELWTPQRTSPQDLQGARSLFQSPTRAAYAPLKPWNEDAHIRWSARATAHIQHTNFGLRPESASYRVPVSINNQSKKFRCDDVLRPENSYPSVKERIGMMCDTTDGCSTE